jgi:hypothetical protein
VTDKRSSKLSEVIALGMADVKISARVEEWLAGFDTFPAK